MQIEDIKNQIVDCCQRLWVRGLVSNHDGNISFKISENEYLVTPTSFSKKDVTHNDLLIVNSQGDVVSGKHKVFSEFSWHKSIYNVRSDINCVVHGHPTVAGGIALAGQEIGTPAIPEAIVSLGRGLLTTRFFSPLEVVLKTPNPAFEQELKRVLRDSDAFLVPGNGVWCVGMSVLQTYLRLELVEEIAQSHQTAKSFGGVKQLPRSLVEELLKRRPQREESNSNYIKNLIKLELEKILTKS